MHNFSAALTFWGWIKAQFHLRISLAANPVLRGSDRLFSPSLQWSISSQSSLGLDLSFTHPPSPPFQFCLWSDCQQFMTCTFPQTVASTQLRGTPPRGVDFRKGKNLLSQLCHSKHYNTISPVLCFWAILCLTLCNPSPNHVIYYCNTFFFFSPHSWTKFDFECAFTAFIFLHSFCQHVGIWMYVCLGLQSFFL